MSENNDHYTSLSPAEYRQAFDDYFTAIRNYIYFKTSDADLSEDLAQDTFVKLWENRDRIDPRTLKSFLYTIANNLTINYLKRQQLYFKFQKSTGMRHDQETPDFLVQMKEYEEKLQEVIAKMTEGSREVFLMNRIEDLKYREIAERLGISVKAVEKRMSQALAELKKKIGTHERK